MSRLHREGVDRHAAAEPAGTYAAAGDRVRRRAVRRAEQPTPDRIGNGAFEPNRIDMSQKFPKAFAVYELRRSEHAAIQDLLRGLQATYASAEDCEFLANARRVAFSSLPEELVRFVDRFRHTEFTPAIAITGFAVDDQRI